MDKKANLIILFLICIFVLLFICFVFQQNKPTYTDYYERLGIRALIVKPSVPLDERTVGDYIYRYYDDISLVFNSSNAFIRAEITGDKYKLDEGISVGSKRDSIEKVFLKKIR
ncbi:MAG: hypothetical protein ACI3XA_07325 [Clostridia bacterium]